MFRTFALLVFLAYGKRMTLEAIKEAIAELTDVDKAALVSWVNMQDSQAWGKQVEADFSNGGAGMALLRQWDAEISSGSSVSLEEFLQQPKANFTH